MRLISYCFLGLAIAFFTHITFASDAAAETVDVVRTTFLDSISDLGVPMVKVRLYSGSGSYLGIVTGNVDGIAEFTNLAEGTYSAVGQPDADPDDPMANDYVPGTIVFTVSKAQASFDAGLGKFVQTIAEPGIVSPANRYIVVTLKEVSEEDPLGTPIGGETVTLTKFTQSTVPLQGVADGSGVARFGIADNETSRFGISASNFSDYEEVTPQEGQNEIAVTLYRTVRDATLTVNLVDALTNETFVVPDPAYGLVTCRYEPTSGSAEEVTDRIETGESSAALLLSSGRLYTCSTYVEGFGTSSFTVNLAHNETRAVDQSIFVKDSRIRIQLVDKSTQESVTALPVQATVWIEDTSAAEAVEYEATESAVNGEIVFDVPGGYTYRFSLVADGDSNFTSNGTYYVFPSTYPEIVVGNDAEVIESVELQSTTSFISVRLLDEDGNPWHSQSGDPGWAQANYFGIVPSTEGEQGAEAASEEVEEHWVIGTLDEDSTAKLPVIADRTYEVSVVPNLSASQKGEYILPGKVNVDTIDNDTVSVEIALQKPNYSLTVNLSAQDEDKTEIPVESLDYIDCFSTNARGEESYSFEIVGSTIILPLRSEDTSKSEQWTIGCFGYQLGDEVENSSLRISATQEVGRQYYLEAVHESKSGDTIGSESIQLEDVGEFFPEEETPFSLNAQTEITFSDNETTLTIPKGAFGETPNTNGIIKYSSARSLQNPPGLPYRVWEITPSVGDEEISEPEKASRLCFLLPGEALEELGVDASVATIQRFDEEREVWLKSSTTVESIEGTTDSRACALAGHFSRWGLFFDIIKEARQSLVTKIRIKPLKDNRRYQVSWRPPLETTAALQYEVSYQFSKSKKQCEEENGKFKTKTVDTPKAILKGKANSSLCVRVKTSGGKDSLPKYKKGKGQTKKKGKKKSKK
ncbi:MAG: hypothetical protein KDD60_01975 [Bdellovibrionales bacterium]|nr:hypothetical protein [Bdellovibrionales bacterium]